MAWGAQRAHQFSSVYQYHYHCCMKVQLQMCLLNEMLPVTAADVRLLST